MNFIQNYRLKFEGLFWNENCQLELKDTTDQTFANGLMEYCAVDKSQEMKCKETVMVFQYFEMYCSALNTSFQWGDLGEIHVFKHY